MRGSLLAAGAGRTWCIPRRRERSWPSAGRGGREGWRRPRSQPRTAGGTLRPRGRPGSGAGRAGCPAQGAGSTDVAKPSSPSAAASRSARRLGSAAPTDSRIGSMTESIRVRAKSWTAADPRLLSNTAMPPPPGCRRPAEPPRPASVSEKTLAGRPRPRRPTGPYGGRSEMATSGPDQRVKVPTDGSGGQCEPIGQHRAVEGPCSSRSRATRARVPTPGSVPSPVPVNFTSPLCRNPPTRPIRPGTRRRAVSAEVHPRGHCTRRGTVGQGGGTP